MHSWRVTPRDSSEFCRSALSSRRGKCRIVKSWSTLSSSLRGAAQKSIDEKIGARLCVSSPLQIGENPHTLAPAGMPRDSVRCGLTRALSSCGQTRSRPASKPWPRSRLADHLRRSKPASPQVRDESDAAGTHCCGAALTRRAGVADLARCAGDGVPRAEPRFRREATTF